MRLGFYNFYRQYNQNRMFQSTQADIGDDLIYPAVYMHDYLTKLGHTVATIDTAPLDSFDAIIFCDYPTKLSSYFRTLVKQRHRNLFLLLIESPAVRPDNWNRANHAPFRKVFTWNPEWADGKKYIQFHMAHKLPEPTPYAPSTARKFCCLIASQKYSWASGELYSERMRAIRWFEQNHPDEFDLYGQRWDRFYLQGKLSLANPVLARLYSAFPFLPKSDKFPSYRGSVPRKRDVMQQYRYSICYENSSHPGWTTEKMLDAMFAGSVPIYQGDPRILDMVPANTFIDKRNFPDYQTLYKYLKGMSESEYEGYRQAIHQFVHGDGIKPFGAQSFPDFILREIVNDPLPK
jgi:hypothetical protein